MARIVLYSYMLPVNPAREIRLTQAKLGFFGGVNAYAKIE
jgi:hypothetical protein